jgi:hypothetical protein
MTTPITTMMPASTLKGVNAGFWIVNLRSGI